MKKINLVYFGTPDFSAKLLEKIINDDLPVDIKFVVTQPDKPVGRKQILTPSPVKLVAIKYNIQVLEYLKIGGTAGRAPDSAQQSEHWREGKPGQNLFSNIDLVLLYAYGKIIPEEILDQPKFGFWNIHPSLLPKYRGPSPIAYPLINGDQKTGVTLMQMDKQVDHGPIIDQEEITINPDDKRPDLENKLTDLGYELFKKNLLRLTTNNLPAESAGQSPVTSPQNHSLATFTHLLKKNDGYLDWQSLTQPQDPKKIYNLFRGLYPWPGIWTLLRPADFAGQGKFQKPMRLKILDMRYENEQLIIKKVQLEGKKEVDFKTFQKAYILS